MAANVSTEEQLLERHRLAWLGGEAAIAQGISARLCSAWLRSSRFRDVEALCLKTLELGPDVLTFAQLGRAKFVLGEVEDALRLYLAAHAICEETNNRPNCHQMERKFSYHSSVPIIRYYNHLFINIYRCL